MQLTARRPHISAGIALASAAVIAAGPMTQHLPKLDVTQHLPKVSVAEINLTDAGSSMVDLFAGVESELSSLAGGGAAAAAVPAAYVSNAVNPLQTWANVLPQTLTNIETIANQWLQYPAPVLQQVLANVIQYGVDYITPYRNVANALVTYYTGPGAGNFYGQLARVSTKWGQGQISQAVSTLYGAFITAPLQRLLPLTKTLTIPGLMLQNLTNATNYLLGTGLTTLANAFTSGPATAFNALGGSLQAVYNAQVSGDSLGALTNFLDIPGQMTNAFFNGYATGFGWLNPGQGAFFNGGFISDLVDLIPRQLAQQIVAPNAQNIGQGGTLAAALQNLETVATQGWPSLTPIMNTLTSNLSNIGSQLTGLLQNLPSVLSNLPSMLSTIATGVGTFIINLLRAL
ncbi:hypothetical protein H7K38_14440 [Mycobacterium alsense]|uniref:PE-PGRS family protein n=1 Tax=Mycobacterium alsense TaxID=324058 RepID=A0AA41XR62_9MYCO|nr:hypothetical protein [Mycobacterium alsense]MCV7379845.1 hypothetical protein [Mycobacterium alsense]